VQTLHRLLDVQRGRAARPLEVVGNVLTSELPQENLSVEPFPWVGGHLLEAAIPVLDGRIDETGETELDRAGGWPGG
jgi:hypothetical protein